MVLVIKLLYVRCWWIIIINNLKELHRFEKRTIWSEFVYLSIVKFKFLCKKINRFINKKRLGTKFKPYNCMIQLKIKWYNLFWGKRFFWNFEHVWDFRVSLFSPGKAWKFDWTIFILIICMNTYYINMIIICCYIKLTLMNSCS